MLQQINQHEREIVGSTEGGGRATVLSAAEQVNSTETITDNMVQPVVTLSKRFSVDEVIVLHQRGRFFHPDNCSDAIIQALATSSQIRQDASFKIREFIRAQTEETINILIFQASQASNTVLWEEPKENIQLGVHGLVFMFWLNESFKFFE